METATTSTRQALIGAAGELFAERGYEGTNIRAIAERAGTNSAAISYYFGSKENLYVAALTHALEESIDRLVWGKLEDPELTRTPERAAQTLHEVIEQRVFAYCSERGPMWHRQLVLRGFVEPSPALTSVVQRMVRPEHDLMVDFLQRCRPGLSREQAQLMSFTLTGQITFYVFARGPLLMTLEREHFDEAFLQLVSRHITGVMLAALGLPPVPGLV